MSHGLTCRGCAGVHQNQQPILTQPVRALLSQSYCKANTLYHQYLQTLKQVAITRILRLASSKIVGVQRRQKFSEYWCTIFCWRVQRRKELFLLRSTATLSIVVVVVVAV